MPRYIDADTLKDKMFNYYDCVNLNTRKDNYKGEMLMNYEVADMIEDCIDNAPTADAEEVWHGKWIYRGHHEMMGYVFQCSVCERWMVATSIKNIIGKYPYCHCGARMNSVEGLEDGE